MRIAFTGPWEGMYQLQYYALRDLLGRLRSPFGDTVAIGDCVGCDEEAHEVASLLGYDIDIRPPANRHLRANLAPVRGILHEPEDYLVRNRRMVDWCDLLVSTPRFPEERRSGTWSTIRYARETQKPRVIIGQRGELMSAGYQIRY